MTAIQTETPRVVSRAEWLTARKALLQQEKELTYRREEIARARRELPRVRVNKTYTFDSKDGPVTLADLFQGRSQLLVYHFMFHPDWVEGCPSCSYLADHFDGTLPHLAARDVSFVAISRARLEHLAAFKRRMGWNFAWVRPTTATSTSTTTSPSPRSCWRRARRPITSSRLPYLFHLRPRARPDHRHLPVARPGAQGAGRGGPRPHDGLGAPPRPL